MIDDAKAVKARDLLVAHLKSIDPKERRKTRVLGILGVISFNLIIVFVALMAYLLWRGYL
jgi:predicted tellurium resistance membrane protein TerC